MQSNKMEKIFEKKELFKIKKNTPIKYIHLKLCTIVLIIVTIRINGSISYNHFKVATKPDTKIIEKSYDDTKKSTINTHNKNFSNNNKLE